MSRRHPLGLALGRIGRLGRSDLLPGRALLGGALIIAVMVIAVPVLAARVPGSSLGGLRISLAGRGLSGLGGLGRLPVGILMRRRLIRPVLGRRLIGVSGVSASGIFSHVQGLIQSLSSGAQALGNFPRQGNSRPGQHMINLRGAKLLLQRIVSFFLHKFPSLFGNAFQKTVILSLYFGTPAGVN